VAVLPIPVMQMAATKVKIYTYLGYLLTINE
jgi:hypothetical protein